MEQNNFYSGKHKLSIRKELRITETMQQELQQCKDLYEQYYLKTAETGVTITEAELIRLMLEIGIASIKKYAGDIQLQLTKTKK
jgi:hypothetical protein